MKRLCICVILILLLSACGNAQDPVVSPETEAATTAPTCATMPPATETVVPTEATLPPTEAPVATEEVSVEPTETTLPFEPTETTLPSEPSETTLPTESPTEPPHSELYIPGVSVEDVIRYFNEVCLDAEFENSGDSSLLQRWDVGIYYHIDGDYTEEDMLTLENFVQWLNTIEGFPGIYETTEPLNANLQIHFCTEEELVSYMGNNFYGTDGGVTFWYMDNKIYEAIICYRSDIGQFTRNSVILEEIYNGLGPVQDTDLREESIIFSGFSEPQGLTQIDELILKLLYHPQMQCGMDAAACEAVIRQLYY